MNLVITQSETKTGYKVSGWKTEGLDCWGYKQRWALIMGQGWCKYSAGLGAILINGKWHTY